MCECVALQHIVTWACKERASITIPVFGAFWVALVTNIASLSATTGVILIMRSHAKTYGE